MLDNKEHDVVAGEGVELGVDAEEPRIAWCNTSFLQELAGKSCVQGLTALNAASREMPPISISVAHKQYLAIGTHHDSLHSQCHAPRSLG
jgi:hypothetical protein